MERLRSTDRTTTTTTDRICKDEKRRRFSIMMKMILVVRIVFYLIPSVRLSVCLRHSASLSRVAMLMLEQRGRVSLFTFSCVRACPLAKCTIVASLDRYAASSSCPTCCIHVMLFVCFCNIRSGGQVLSPSSTTIASNRETRRNESAS